MDVELEFRLVAKSELTWISGASRSENHYYKLRDAKGKVVSPCALASTSVSSLPGASCPSVRSFIRIVIGAVYPRLYSTTWALLDLERRVTC